MLNRTPFEWTVGAVMVAPVSRSCHRSTYAWAGNSNLQWGSEIRQQFHPQDHFCLRRNCCQPSVGPSSETLQHSCRYPGTSGTFCGTRCPWFLECPVSDFGWSRPEARRGFRIRHSIFSRSSTNYTNGNFSFHPHALIIINFSVYVPFL